MHARGTAPIIEPMSTEREYDQDTGGDGDENTLDGSEGLDADVLTTDGEDVTMIPPETWRSAEENQTLDEKLEAERPDVDASVLDGDGVPAKTQDAVDYLDPDDPRVIAEDDDQGVDDQDGLDDQA